MKDIIDDSTCASIADADERQWERFYTAFAPVLNTYAIQRGSTEPEDAVQDVFAKFVDKVRSGRFHASTAAEVCAYLKTQMRNHVIDAHRRAAARCRESTVAFDEFAVPIQAAAPHEVEIREERSIRRRCRRQAIAEWKCSEKTKRIFIACTIDERPICEVATHFHVPAATVRQIRHRGIARIEQYFAAVV